MSPSRCASVQFKDAEFHVAPTHRLSNDSVSVLAAFGLGTEKGTAVRRSVVTVGLVGFHLCLSVSGPVTAQQQQQPGLLPAAWQQEASSALQPGIYRHFLK